MSTGITGHLVAARRKPVREPVRDPARQRAALWFPELMYPVPCHPGPPLSTLMRRRAAWGIALVRGRAGRRGR
ncbi:hypothetical protein [Streptomyces cirratus]|uniref:hypothetical protein n=1 Tax=Streptomyces cirratus TaxID=68187 RepID=UPI00167D2AC5|nr:hypothetical protein [Streptomyces cirratus]